MKIRILETFTGYPDDTDASRTTYRAGSTPDLPHPYAKLIVAKGLGVEDTPSTADSALSRVERATTSLSPAPVAPAASTLPLSPGMLRP